MGVFPMSLINKMLQDLDARRADAPHAQPFGQQIRAVPEPSRMHSAGWAVLGVAVLSSGLAAWLWIRSPASSAVVPVPVPMPMPPKLNGDSSMNKAAVPPMTPVSGVQPAVASQLPAKVEPVQVEAAAMPDAKVREPVAVLALTPAAVKPPVAAKAVVPAPKVSVAAFAVTTPLTAVLDNRATEPPPASAAKKTSEPIKLEKRITEFTLQQRAENEYRMALAALEHGKNAEAIAQLEQALRLDPRHLGARSTLIKELIGAGRKEDAIGLAKEGLAADPGQAGMAMTLARLQVDKGDLRPAIETMERGLSSGSERPDFRAFLGALLQREGNHKQAAEHYQAALQKNSQNGVWWMGLAISLQADNRPSDALDGFRKAKATNTLSADLLNFVDARINQLAR
jgi:MSHA biogenesis protein MshN